MRVATVLAVFQGAPPNLLERTSLLKFYIFMNPLLIPVVFTSIGKLCQQCPTSI